MPCLAADRKPAPLHLVSTVRVTEHRGLDDLVSAGLGLEGLRNPVPPALAEPGSPTAAELRRRAIWSNWRGIADLSPGGGLEELHGPLPRVPGREFQAFARLPGARHPHRVLLQLPDGFDAGQRCVVVAPASGSRGVYGAIALAAPWALPRGCAVVYTDKGAGSGWFDLSAGQGAALDGRLASGEDPEFISPHASDDPLIAVKHAHSGDHPEAHWGLHVQQAALFALQVLNEQRGKDETAYEPGNTRVLAVGLSNGAAAVLRAAEVDGDLFDAVVAISPNIFAPRGGRQLLDYVSEAALWLPCALGDARFDGVELARPGGAVPPSSVQRCASLRQAGLVTAIEPAAQAAEAYDRLQAGGWTHAALQASALSTGFDLWRAVGAAYASAYARRGAQDMPCGYSYAVLDAAGRPRPPRAEERALWWSDTSGIPPAGGVALRDTMAHGDDPAFAALVCLRALVDGDDTDATALAVRQSMQETRARLPRAGLPIVLMHGLHDGLIPEAFSSGPYSAWLAANERPHTYWRLDNAQHFDAFLGMPALARRYVPLLPYAWHALDAVWSHLQDGTPLPDSATVNGRARALHDGVIESLQASHLAIPHR